MKFPVLCAASLAALILTLPHLGTATEEEFYELTSEQIGNILNGEPISNRLLPMIPRAREEIIQRAPGLLDDVAVVWLGGRALNANGEVIGQITNYSDDHDFTQPGNQLEVMFFFDLSKDTFLPITETITSQENMGLGFVMTSGPDPDEFYVYTADTASSGFTLYDVRAEGTGVLHEQRSDFSPDDKDIVITSLQASMPVPNFVWDTNDDGRITRPEAFFDNVIDPATLTTINAQLEWFNEGEFVETQIAPYPFSLEVDPSLFLQGFLGTSEAPKGFDPELEPFFIEIKIDDALILIPGEVVPEPQTYAAILLLALVGVSYFRRRK